jgi:hypothetical protein
MVMAIPSLDRVKGWHALAGRVTRTPGLVSASPPRPHPSGECRTRTCRRIESKDNPQERQPVHEPNRPEDSTDRRNPTVGRGAPYDQRTPTLSLPVTARPAPFRRPRLCAARGRAWQAPNGHYALSPFLTQALSHLHSQARRAAAEHLTPLDIFQVFAGRDVVCDEARDGLFQCHARKVCAEAVVKSGSE